MRLSNPSKQSVQWRQQGTALFILAFSISLLSAFLAFTEKTDGLDWLFYDSAMALSRLAPADDIVVIEIDDKSLSRLGRWPWPRSRHAQLMDSLTAADSRAIVFDVLFPEPDQTRPAADRQFAQALKHHPNDVMPIYLEQLGQQGQIIESPPYYLFYREVSALGHVHLPAEEDGIVRRVFLKEGVGSAYWPHLSLALIELIEAERENKEIPGSRTDQIANVSVGIHRDYLNLIPMPGQDQGLLYFSYSDVIEGAVDTSKLKDKIVFIGATAAGLGDVLAAPIGSMSGVELNAWIFQALRHQQLIQSYSAEILAGISFSVVFLMVFLLGQLSPRLFLVVSIALSAGIMLISAALLLTQHVWLPPSSILLGILVFYPLWSWLRAERILRFLRGEIASLSETVKSPEKTLDSKPLAQAFLAQVGMIDSESGQQTKRGKQACLALFAMDENETETENFWPGLVQQLDLNKQQTREQPSGIELISRTIDQLNAIKANDHKNRQLIEKSLAQLQDGVCIADLCGEITFSNHRFQQWFQNQDFRSDRPGQDGSPSLLTALKRLQLKSGDAWPEVIARLFERGQLATCEARLSEGDDLTFLCQASLVSINERYKDTLIFTFTEITQLKAAEKARAEALSFLSHDLRSPMVSVLAILDKHRSQAFSGRSHLSDEALEHIESLVRKNLDYAESFLQLSKADALLEDDKTPCDLHAVFDHALVQAFALATAKNIHVETERGAEDMWICGDAALLERAMSNLISNAVKFSPVGSTITLSLLKHNDEAEFTVADQGPGIEQKDQEKVFQRFTCLKSDIDNQGAGLGLHFVKTVAEKHKGRVSLSSQPMQGARFMIHLPLIEFEI